MPNRPNRVEVRRVEYGSLDYSKTVELRSEVLRKPLGLTFTPEFLAQDAADFHFAAFKDERLLGCLILHPSDQKSMKMRQVAVSSESQGLGVGRTLVEASEAFAREKNFKQMLLNARDTAVKFYLNLGYEVVGDTFIEVGIPHNLMRKSL